MLTAWDVTFTLPKGHPKNPNSWAWNARGLVLAQNALEAIVKTQAEYPDCVVHSVNKNGDRILIQ